jgi:hypothetical protein
MLMRLAEWVRDDHAERAFNVAVWGIPPTSILFLFDIPFFRFTILLYVLWGIAVLAFPVALLSLSGSLDWSIQHAREYHDRLRRQRRRAQDYDEGVGETVAAMDRARQIRQARERSRAPGPAPPAPTTPPPIPLAGTDEEPEEDLP